MRLDNDYFLEDFLDIYYLCDKGMIITYDTLLHQSLEKYLIGDVNIIIKGHKIDKRFFKNEWYLLRNCKITNIICYGNFISYTIRWEKEEDNSSIHVKRKING